VNHDFSRFDDHSSMGVSGRVNFDGTNLRVVMPMYEEVKRMLQSYQYCLWRINQNKEMIEKLRALAEKTSPSYSLAPGGDTKDSMANAAAKIADLEREIDADTARLKDELAQVEFLISSLDNFQERQIIEYRYKHGYSWRAIQREIPYGRTQIFRLHMSALEKILSLIKRWD
jgi:DNA-directed RNA polymerase specialized sigma subunit